MADEQRLRRKRRSHSKKLSVSFSRNRWSDETPTNAGRINVSDITIKFKDIFKLLRYSQIINVRRISSSMRCKR